MATTSRDRALYIISVAAELAGVHPQTLRIYERKGLIEPSRTEGRSRRYSDRDIALLQRIQELTNEGVSLVGVRKVLELEAELDDALRDAAAAPRSSGPTTSSGPPWKRCAAPTGATWCPCGRRPWSRPASRSLRAPFQRSDLHRCPGVGLRRGIIPAQFRPLC